MGRADPDDGVQPGGGFQREGVAGWGQGVAGGGVRVRGPVEQGEHPADRVPVPVPVGARRVRDPGQAGRGRGVSTGGGERL